VFQRPPVAKSADWERVRTLPVRTDADYPADLVDRMTEALRVPGSTAKLREVQAKALYDVGKYRRGFLPLRVGAGKTLVSLLIPRLIPCRRPVLLVPANLLGKTVREMETYKRDWQIARHIQVKSYQKMGRDTGARELELEQPDLILADECHFLKNPKAAVTRRVARYMASKPDTKFIPMSGTIMKDSIRDFAHLLEWSHGQDAPIPLYAATLNEWADALDEGVNPMATRSPGVLLDLHPGAYDDDGALGDDNRARGRRVFRARVNATGGIVSSDSQEDYTGSLYIQGEVYKVNAATEANFKKLRTEMCRPDGWMLSEAMQCWAIARQIALGLHYEWDPPAPEEWLQARKEWASFVRACLKDPWSERNEIDSEFQVTTAVLHGKIPDECDFDDRFWRPKELLTAWQEVKPIFRPHAVPVWHDEGPVKAAAHWLETEGKKRGIVWVEHTFFGRRLAQLTGRPYFGAEGLDDRGRFIEDFDSGMIASSAANRTGRNLQFKWTENYITAPPMDSEYLEQLIGRTHRSGQPADTVPVYIPIGCREHLMSVPRARSAAGVKGDLLGYTQKITLADIDWPDLDQGQDWRWRKIEGVRDEDDI
jgi:hypothetical protein